MAGFLGSSGHTLPLSCSSRATETSRHRLGWLLRMRLCWTESCVAVVVCALHFLSHTVLAFLNSSYSRSPLLPRTRDSRAILPASAFFALCAIAYACHSRYSPAILTQANVAK
ncbi:hypothetical protein C8F01DRAFT_1127469 [Mycena amicta]|nr:hypothetical protein C8F01DRAFT_1127469 [Mycena amicta]